MRLIVAVEHAEGQRRVGVDSGLAINDAIRNADAVGNLRDEQTPIRRVRDLLIERARRCRTAGRKLENRGPRHAAVARFEDRRVRRCAPRIRKRDDRNLVRVERIDSDARLAVGAMQRIGRVIHDIDQSLCTGRCGEERADQQRCKECRSLASHLKSPQKTAAVIRCASRKTRSIARGSSVPSRVAKTIAPASYE